MSNSVPQSKSFSLNSEELEKFHRQGFWGPFTVYAPEEMEMRWRQERLRLLDRTHAIYGDEAAISGSTNIANYDRHLDSEFLAQHICRPEIVDRVASVLGPNVLCWRTEFFPKYPGDEGTDWHQADTFANASGTPQILWPAGSEDFGGTITVWTAFTEATKANGCLQFIPGTHKTMFYDESLRMHYDPERVNISKDGTKRGFFGYDYRELQIDPEWKPDEENAISMTMRPGEAILFWSTLMHASHPHDGTTSKPRMGFASRYVPTSVRIYPDSESIEEYGGKVSLKNYGAVLVAGEDDGTLNRLAERTTRGEPFRRR